MVPSMSAGAVIDGVLDLVFPKRCVQCRAVGAWLCERCAAGLQPLPAPRCSRCGRRVSGRRLAPPADGSAPQSCAAGAHRPGARTLRSPRRAAAANAGAGTWPSRRRPPHSSMKGRLAPWSAPASSALCARSATRWGGLRCPPSRPPAASRAEGCPRAACPPPPSTSSPGFLRTADVGSNVASIRRSCSPVGLPVPSGCRMLRCSAGSGTARARAPSPAPPGPPTYATRLCCGRMWTG